MPVNPPYLIPHLLQDSKIHYGFKAGSVPPQIGWRERRLPKWELAYEWRENKPFYASLKFVQVRSDPGRVTLEHNETGARYSMTLGNLRKLLTKGSIIYGTVIGKWKFQKNGDSYSLVFVP